jgi:very-short-patch-repair endonuclease
MPEHKVAEERRSFAKEQRRGMTRAEALLWQALRGWRTSGWKFKRQVPFGPYVADFSCAEAKLIVELDGPPHGTPEQKMRDQARDAWFASRGFRVLRLSNDLVLGAVELAVKQVEQALTAPSPGLLRRPPSPSRGEG